MTSRSAILMLVPIVGIVGWARNGHPSRSAPVALVQERAPYDPNTVYQKIVFFERRARSDPRGALARVLLAGAYLQHCRETGDLADAVRAERAARESLAIRVRHNVAARDMLGLSLFTQHRFAEALAEAKRAS